MSLTPSTYICPACGRSFQPPKPTSRNCSRACANRTRSTRGNAGGRGKRSELHVLLTDDAVWRRRSLGVAGIRFLVPLATPTNWLSKHLNARGWLFTAGHPDAPVTAAPCRTCNRKRVPVEHLNEKRECRECRRAKGWAA